MFEAMVAKGFALIMSRGITFIEVLIGLLIVAILAVAVIPSYVSHLQYARITGAANHLYYTLVLARSEALKRQTPVFVNVVSGSAWCYGANPSSGCSCNVANSCALGRSGSDVTAGLSLTTSGLSSGALQFDSTHGRTNSTSTLTFTVTGQNTAITLKIDQLGHAQICSNTISGYQGC